MLMKLKNKNKKQKQNKTEISNTLFYESKNKQTIMCLKKPIKLLIDFCCYNKQH